MTHLSNGERADDSIPKTPRLPARFRLIPRSSWRSCGLLDEVRGALHEVPVSDRNPRTRGRCLRAAVQLFKSASYAAPAVQPLLAIGRLHLPTGSAHDHAWILARTARSWRILDAAAQVPSAWYEPLLLLNRDTAWTSAPPDVLSSLRPQFFLSVHCNINSDALKGVLDASLIDDINRMNARVDDPLVHPNYDPREHFDNALIMESITLLEDRLRWDGETPLHTVAAGAQKATAYGLACHAVADFYAHSNYAPIALAYTGDPKKVPTLDEAIGDPRFIDFMSTRWSNPSMWRQHEGYGTPDPPAFTDPFARCLFTGGYSGDGWIPRAEVPHHNVFAVDAPDSALVRAPEIQRRQNPFAYPGEWLAQFKLRSALARRHVRNAVQRAKSGDPNPFLGARQGIPESLLPPPWRRDAVLVVDTHPLPDRGLDGWLLPASG